MSRAPVREQLSDEEIIRRVQQGEPALYGMIFDRHSARLERYLRRLGLAGTDLEDALSETFVRGFARQQSFDVNSGTRYISYLYAIARNLVTDWLRERGRAREVLVLEDLWEEPDASEPPVATVIRHDQVSRIRRAMTHLGVSDREIIFLSYDCELTSREIMQIMGKPSITAVTTHLHKALKRLRELTLAAEAARVEG